MDTHKNASLTPKGREMMVRAVVDLGLSKAAVARQFNTTPKTVAKWIAGDHMDPDKAGQKWVAQNKAKVNAWLGK